MASISLVAKATLISGCVLLLATVPAQSSQVAFTPMPAVPTLDDCTKMNSSDVDAVRAWDRSENERIEAESSQSCSLLVSLAGCNEIQRELAVNLNEHDLLLAQVNQRYRQCVSEANAAHSASQRSLAISLGSDAGQAWMSGIGHIPDSAWQRSSKQGDRLVSLTEMASFIVKQEQQTASAMLRLRFAQEIITSLSTTSVPSGNSISNLSQLTDYSTDLIGTNLPPWSAFFATFAANALRTIGVDAMNRLNTEIASFDAAASSNVIARRMTELEQGYQASLTAPVGQQDSRLVSALADLSVVSQQMAALSAGVTMELATIRQEEATRRASVERAQQQAAIAAQQAANAAAVQAQEAANAAQQAAARRQADLEAEQRARQQQNDDDNDDYMPPSSYVRAPVSVPMPNVYVPRPSYRGGGGGLNCVSRPGTTCGVQ